MKIIGLDASSANKNERTGVEWYAYHLIQNLKKHALKENERVLLYSPAELRGALNDLPNGWQAQILNWPFARGWMQGRVSWEMFKNKPDLLFVPAQSLPRILGKKTVTTIHDLGFRHYPEWYEAGARHRLELATQDAINRADQIITVSEATRQDLLASYPIRPEKISVTPLAYDLGVFKTLPTQDIQAARAEYQINHPYFMFVGRLEAKKNILTLLKAFDEFSAHTASEYNLVLAGSPGFGYAEIHQAIERSPNKHLIKRPGYLPGQQTAALLNAAAGFCFPSWFEGFGLPNLEAMACGTPLIVSDIPAHREVVLNAALFVAPDDSAGWARAMGRLASNPHLANQLAERGRERARDFSWAQTAEQTWGIFRNLL
ncbi:glycosyltransferase family 4 protein [Patescibacteria group bacterium]|nr:glycosyltransferase family 4 protein [Patescibacteria group bacterium]MBU1705755.1 glycosyltransferase family 4 protein [Patescibacteria group bacterium]